MLANEVFKQALVLLNYTDPHGNIDAVNNAELYKRALPLLNQIYADLWHIRTGEGFQPLTSLSQVVPLESYVVNNIMPYGVAMLIAQTNGDADNQAIYAALYNQRRSAAQSVSDRITDRLPRAYL